MPHGYLLTNFNMTFCLYYNNSFTTAKGKIDVPEYKLQLK